MLTILVTLGPFLKPSIRGTGVEAFCLRDEGSFSIPVVYVVLADASLPRARELQHSNLHARA